MTFDDIYCYLKFQIASTVGRAHYGTQKVLRPLNDRYYRQTKAFENKKLELG